MCCYQLRIKLRIIITELKKCPRFKLLAVLLLTQNKYLMQNKLANADGRGRGLSFFIELLGFDL